MNGPAWFDETQAFPIWAYFLIAAVLLILASVLTIRQNTTVGDGGVRVRYGFLYQTQIAFSEMARAEAITYHPIRDYGGWGIRGLGRRRALNTRGNQGVLIIRRDGSTLLIGSQEPRELLAALARGGVATEDRLPPVVRDF